MQVPRPLLPAHSMSSLIEWLTLEYWRLQVSSATMGTSTSCRCWGDPVRRSQVSPWS